MEIESILITYLGVIKKFAEFSGRTGRREFWTFAICNAVIGAAFGILSRIPVLGVLFGIVSALFSLAILVPSIAVGFRRLHDTNRSGMFMLLCLVPLVGAIILLVFCAQDGTPGDNQYGADPKSVQ